MNALYKIIPLEQWHQSQKQPFLSTTDDTFIHFSTETQVIKTLQKFYATESVMLLQINPEKLIGELRFETNPGRQNKYYHLYNGQVPMNSIISVYKLEPQKLTDL